MKNVIISGARGFIGRALCNRLCYYNKVIGVDITTPTDVGLNITWEQADLTNQDFVPVICKIIPRMLSFAVPVLCTRRSER
jgi:nucleoside-diphosphate-sugar epimerase